MRVASRIARAVDFRCINLVDEGQVATVGAVDIVICRNVLIYFRDQTIERVVAGLWRQLVPDGYLIVGASESLLRFETSFECEEQRGTFLYRKVAK
jgi:chemotaxis protein methyltransferase CheR